MVNSKDKKLTCYDVSKLIGKAWSKTASISNGISALKSTGIYPYDSNAIPDSFFALFDALHEQNLIEHGQENVPDNRRIVTSTDTVLTISAMGSIEETSRTSVEPQPGTSRMEISPSKILAEVYPMPKLLPMTSKNKQKAAILTSPDHIKKRKLIAEKKKSKDLAKNKHPEKNQRQKKV